MGRHVQLVMGPAGSGKSTFCHLIQQHCDASRRTVHVVNLDPAAEHFGYRVSADIRDLISLDDVTEALRYGPNGGLVYCMEYLVKNLDWLRDSLDGVGGSDDEYFLIDCPGQIELFSHIPVMREVCDALKSWDYKVCGVYLIDSVFVDDPSKYISGVLMALSAMIQLEIAHINVITKCDRLADPEGGVEKFLNPDTHRLREAIGVGQFMKTGKHKRLNDAILSLLEDYSMVNFLPLNAKDEESVDYVLSSIDHAMNYGEDLEPKEPKDSQEEPDE